MYVWSEHQKLLLQIPILSSEFEILYNSVLEYLAYLAHVIDKMDITDISTVRPEAHQLSFCETGSKQIADRMSNRTGSAENDNTMDHECNICWEKFELKQHLESHKIRFHNPKISKMIDEVHQGLKLFSCNSCDKSYGNFMELNNHFKMVHKGGKKSQNDLATEFMKDKTAIKDNQNLKEIKISQQDNVDTENKPEETQFIKKNIVGKSKFRT